MYRIVVVELCALFGDKKIKLVGIVVLESFKFKMAKVADVERAAKRRENFLTQDEFKRGGFSEEATLLVEDVKEWHDPTGQDRLPLLRLAAAVEA